MTIDSRRDAGRIANLAARVEEGLDDAGIEAVLDAAERRCKTSADAPEIERLLAGADLDTAAGRELFATLRDLAALDGENAFSHDAEIEIEVAPDALGASALITPPIGAGRPLTLEAVRFILRDRAGVHHGIDEPAITRALAEFGDLPVRLAVARATPPTPGGAETWLIEGAADRRIDGHLEDRVDYREAIAARGVAPGMRIATRLPGTPGAPGRDVYGRELPPPPPPPAEALLPGPGVEARPDGLYATRAGEVRREENRLLVVPQLTIEGDVDLSTGNVDFPGALVIRGSVQDGFTVRADGDIEIRGMIAAARVEATGSISVAGGIVTREEGRVVAGRDIVARFIENSTVEAGGSIKVRRSILHSRVSALGTIEVLERPGCVIGGVIRVGLGLECRGLGAAGGTRTAVHFGEDFRLTRRLAEIAMIAAGLRDRLRTVEVTLGPLEDPAPGSPIGADHDALVARLQALRHRILDALRAMLRARVEAIGRAGEAPEGQVKVGDEALPGVDLFSRGVHLVIETAHARCRFRLTGERIEVGPYE